MELILLTMLLFESHQVIRFYMFQNMQVLVNCSNIGIYRFVVINI